MTRAALPPQYLRGIQLFNAGEYFACHEALEEIWLHAQGVERDFLHALIQAAVALHHCQRGNYKGAASVYDRARRKLSALPPQVMRLETAVFAQTLEEFFSEALNPGVAPSSLPQIRLKAGD